MNRPVRIHEIQWKEGDTYVDNKMGYVWVVSDNHLFTLKDEIPIEYYMNLRCISHLLFTFTGNVEKVGVVDRDIEVLKNLMSHHFKHLRTQLRINIENMAMILDTEPAVITAIEKELITPPLELLLIANRKLGYDFNLEILKGGI